MFRRLITKLLAWHGTLKENMLNSPKSHDIETNEGNTFIEVSSPQDMVAKLEKLMEKGNYAACFDLGQLYYLGDKGVQKDIHRAMSYFKEAADNGIAMAAYQMAAEQGHTKAMVNLATCYEMGIGVNRDLSEAYHWYLEASKHGDQFAAQKLSYYEQGNL